MWLVFTAHADDAAAVAPFRDGAVVAHVWNEHVEVVYAGPEGVRAREVRAAETDVTNPAVSCDDRRGCLVGWITVRDGVGVAHVAPYAPGKSFDDEAVDAGPATRLHLVPEPRGSRALLEAPPAAERPTGRTLHVASLDRHGVLRAGPRLVTPDPVLPYTARFADDGAILFSTAGDREPRGWRVAPGADAAVPSDAGWNRPLPVCGDGRPIPAGADLGAVCGKSLDAFANVGARGTQVWVDHDERVHVGVVDGGAVTWATEVEHLTPARTSWIVRCGFFPWFEADNDGKRPFHVPLQVTEVHGGSFTLTFGGPVSGRATARAPDREESAAAFAGGGDFPHSDGRPPGDVWFVTRGAPGHPFPVSVEAHLPVDALVIPGPLTCGAPVRLDWDGPREIWLVFERHATAFRADLSHVDPGAETWTVDGTWVDNRCGLSGPGTLVVEQEVGAVVWSQEREVAHRGLVPF
jgi:hypothetical protein